MVEPHGFDERPIGRLDLTARTYSHLALAGLHSIGSVRTAPDEELLDLPELTASDLVEIRNAVETAASERFAVDRADAGGDEAEDGDDLLSYLRGGHPDAEEIGNSGERAAVEGPGDDAESVDGDGFWDQAVWGHWDLTEPPWPKTPVTLEFIDWYVQAFLDNGAHESVHHLWRHHVTPAVKDLPRPRGPRRSESHRKTRREWRRLTTGPGSWARDRFDGREFDAPGVLRCWPGAPDERPDFPEVELASLNKWEAIQPRAVPLKDRDEAAIAAVPDDEMVPYELLYRTEHDNDVQPYQVRCFGIDGTVAEQTVFPDLVQAEEWVEGHRVAAARRAQRVRRGR